jgi:hypothetical protein
MKTEQSGLSAGMSRGLINGRAAKTSYLVILGMLFAMLTQLVNADPVKLKICNSPATKLCPYMKAFKFEHMGPIEDKYEVKGKYVLQTIDNGNLKELSQIPPVGECAVIDFDSKDNSVDVITKLLFRSDAVNETHYNEKSVDYAIGESKLTIKKGEKGWNEVGACDGDDEARITVYSDCNNGPFRARLGAAPCD